MVAKSNRRRKSISVIDLSSLASLLHPTIQRLSVLSLTTFPFHRRQSFMDNRSFNSTFRSYLCPVSVPHYYKSLCVPSFIDFVFRFLQFLFSAFGFSTATTCWLILFVRNILRWIPGGQGFERQAETRTGWNKQTCNNRRTNKQE